MQVVRKGCGLRHHPEIAGKKSSSKTADVNEDIRCFVAKLGLNRRERVKNKSGDCFTEKEGRLLSPSSRRAQALFRKRRAAGGII
jgi:hypothetical protein